MSNAADDTHVQTDSDSDFLTRSSHKTYSEYDTDLDYDSGNLVIDWQERALEVHERVLDPIIENGSTALPLLGRINQKKWKWDVLETDNGIFE